MIAFNLYNPESVAVIIVVWGVFHILRCFISSITNQIMVLRYYYWLWLICVCFREWLGRLMCLKCLRYYIIKPDLLLFYNCLKFVFLHNLRQTTNFHMNRVRVVAHVAALVEGTTCTRGCFCNHQSVVLRTATWVTKKPEYYTGHGCGMFHRNHSENTSWVFRATFVIKWMKIHAQVHCFDDKINVLSFTYCIQNEHAI